MTTASNTAPSGASDAPVSGTNNEAKKCFANYHMTWAEHGLYVACKSLANAGPTGFLYLNAPKLANLARSNSKRSSKRSSETTVYKYAKALERLGFFVLKKASTKDGEGKNTSTVYSVLEHDQWAKLHPGECDKIQCQIREEEEEHHHQLLDSPSPIPVLTVTNSCSDQHQELVTIFLPTIPTNESSYKPLPTNPAPISGDGDLNTETETPSAEARAVVPPSPAPIIGDGLSLAARIEAERLALLRLGRDANGYFDLDSGERVSTDEFMRRRKKHQERQGREAA
jgi:hypothetical protein